MIHSMKSGRERFELRKLEHFPDQSLLPEEVGNLAQVFYFILQFDYTTEFEYRHRTLETFQDASEWKFHVQLSKVYSKDEDSLSEKLHANFSKEDVPEEVQNVMTGMIVDFTGSITGTPPCSARLKVDTILVKIGVANEFSMQDGVFSSVMVRLRIKDCNSLMGEDCVICLEEFSGEGDVALMPCLHAYHSDCIGTWLKTTPRCPICRFYMCPTIP